MYESSKSKDYDCCHKHDYNMTQVHYKLSMRTSRSFTRNWHVNHLSHVNNYYSDSTVRRLYI